MLTFWWDNFGSGSMVSTYASGDEGTSTMKEEVKESISRKVLESKVAIAEFKFRN